jgi:hypothetical protein
VFICNFFWGEGEGFYRFILDNTSVKTWDCVGLHFIYKPRWGHIDYLTWGPKAPSILTFSLELPKLFPKLYPMTFLGELLCVLYNFFGERGRDFMIFT